MNKRIRKIEYNKKNFLEVLNNNLSSIEYLVKTTDTIELFLCKI